MIYPVLPKSCSYIVRVMLKLEISVIYHYLKSITDLLPLSYLKELDLLWCLYSAIIYVQAM